MKKSIILYLLICISIIPPFSAQATQSAPAAEVRLKIMEKAEHCLSSGQSGQKIEKRLHRLEKRLGQPGIDFTDPINKWLWFGLLGIGLALLFSIVSFGLAGLVGFAAIVCLVIWVIKREQAV